MGFLLGKKEVELSVCIFLINMNGMVRINFKGIHDCRQ